MAKILILTPQLPYPPFQGTSLRNYHIIQGLAQRHQISLLSFLEEDQSAAAELIGPLLALCAQIWTVPLAVRTGRQRLLQLLASRRPDLANRLRSTQFEEKLASLLADQKFDIIQIEGLELAHFLDAIIASGRPCRILFDNHNSETELQRRAFAADLATLNRWPAALYSWLQIGRIRRFERWACGQADWVTVVSDADRRSLLAILPTAASPVTVVPNCIDVQSYEPDHSTAESGQDSEADQPDPRYTFDVLFTGKMDYRPNVDAVLWFARSIWPRIQSTRPGTTWAVVGQQFHRRLEPLRRVEGIIVTGRVERIQPYLAGAGVYVAPFRIGSGTRLKLIEAMAAGKAIVSTPVGAEGYDVTHDRELLLASSEAEMASAVLHLLDHAEERSRLGRAARSFAERYDWRRIVPMYEGIYEQMAAH
jgi:glycosyltransferase involved in cell wall biosynthesis